jgi:hypothetical protein
LLGLILLHHLAGEVYEDVCDLLVVLGRRLEVTHLLLAAILFDIGGRDGSAVNQIALIADQVELYVLFSVVLDLCEPKLVDVLIALGIGDVVHQKDAVGALVVGAGDGPEALLAGCVPDLELNHLAVDIHGLEPEVDPNGGQVVLVELVVSEPEQEARLAHPRIADNHQLVQEIVLLDHSIIITPTLSPHILEI